MTTISRDTFAHEDIVRETVHLNELTGPTCAWCGHAGFTKSGQTRRLFRYGIHRDGINTRPEFQDKLFCCVDCMRTYNA